MLCRAFCHYSQIRGSKKTANFVREFSANILLRALARSACRQLEMRRYLLRAAECGRAGSARRAGVSNFAFNASSSSGGVSGGCFSTMSRRHCRSSASETFLGGAAEAAGASPCAGTSASIGGNTSIPTVSHRRLPSDEQLAVVAVDLHRDGPVRLERIAAGIAASRSRSPAGKVR